MNLPPPATAVPASARSEGGELRRRGASGASGASGVGSAHSAGGAGVRRGAAREKEKGGGVCCRWCAALVVLALGLVVAMWLNWMILCHDSLVRGNNEGMVAELRESSGSMADLLAAVSLACYSSLPAFCVWRVAFRCLGLGCRRAWCWCMQACLCFVLGCRRASCWCVSCCWDAGVLRVGV